LLLIDFLSTKRWHLPLDLLEHYERFLFSLTEAKRIAIIQSSSLLQHWYQSLPIKAQARVVVVKHMQGKRQDGLQTEEI